MANPSRRVGTSYENKVLERLRRAFGPQVERSAAGTKSRDFVGTPFPVEAKKRKTLDVPGWVRNMRTLGWDEWAIFCCPRDIRTASGFCEVVVIPADFAESLFKMYADYKCL